MRSLYPYHNAAFAPNKYILRALICLLFASELISPPKLGAGLRYCSSVDRGRPRGQNRSRRSAALAPRKFCGILMGMGLRIFVGILMGPYRSQASQVLWKIDRAIPSPPVVCEKSNGMAQRGRFTSKEGYVVRSSNKLPTALCPLFPHKADMCRARLASLA